MFYLLSLLNFNKKVTPFEKVSQPLAGASLHLLVPLGEGEKKHEVFSPPLLLPLPPASALMQVQVFIKNSRKK